VPSMTKHDILSPVAASDSLNQQVSQIAILGTGLLGASLGLGLRAARFRGSIIGYGRRMATVERAKALGCIDQATTNLAEAVDGCELVVMATPVGVFTSLLERLADCGHPSLVITDVGSTKQQVCSDADRLLPNPTYFIGSHPMAGSERQGPDAAIKDLFDDKSCIMTPSKHTSPAATSLVQQLWGSLGMNVIQMSSAEHDQKVACVSHLPHAIAAMLMRLADQWDATQIASSGFRDTTRLASGDPTVWTDIFKTNRKQVIKAVDALALELQQFRKLLVDHADDNLELQLQQCKKMRDKWALEPEGDE